jgi:hypothetical protein
LNCHVSAGCGDSAFLTDCLTTLQSFFSHVFNGCYAFLMFVVVVFFLIYGVEVYFKVCLLFGCPDWGRCPVHPKLVFNSRTFAFWYVLQVRGGFLNDSDVSMCQGFVALNSSSPTSSSSPSASSSSSSGACSSTPSTVSSSRPDDDKEVEEEKDVTVRLMKEEVQCCFRLTRSIAAASPVLIPFT